jgi:hypothetical protein
MMELIMRLLILAAFLAAPASTPAAVSPTAPAASPPEARAPSRPPTTALAARECRRPNLVQTRTPLSPQATPLGEMPPADLTLAVYNEVDGCLEPRVVRYGVGR